MSSTPYIICVLCVTSAFPTLLSECVFSVSSTTALTETALICLIPYSKGVSTVTLLSVSVVVSTVWVFRAKLSVLLPWLFWVFPLFYTQTLLIPPLSISITSGSEAWEASQNPLSPVCSVTGLGSWGLVYKPVAASPCSTIFTNANKSCSAHPISFLRAHSKDLFIFQ